MQEFEASLGELQASLGYRGRLLPKTTTNPEKQVSSDLENAGAGELKAGSTGFKAGSALDHGPVLSWREGSLLKCRMS